MKLADLKRIAVGTRLRIVESLLGPTDKARVVAKVQSNAILFTGDGIKDGEFSYLHLPKASEFRSDDNGFTIFEIDDYSVPGEVRRVVAARYVFDNNP